MKDLVLLLIIIRYFNLTPDLEASLCDSLVDSVRVITNEQVFEQLAKTSTKLKLTTKLERLSIENFVDMSIYITS